MSKVYLPNQKLETSNDKDWSDMKGKRHLHASFRIKVSATIMDWTDMLQVYTSKLKT